jgi:hypothetical protein
MKKFFYIICLILVVFFPLEKSFSYYLPDDNKKISIQIKKTSILLKKHTDKLEKQLKFYQFKLDLKNDAKINSWLDDIKKIKRGLDAIKYDKIDNLKANILIKSIINRLKTINNELKPYLKKKIQENKIEVNKIKNKYKNVIKKFNERLIRAIIKIKGNLKKKKNLTSKDKAIIYHLEKIKVHIINLNKFYNIDFYTTKSIKQYLKNNIKSIYNEINEIKKIIKRA